MTQKGRVFLLVEKRHRIIGTGYMGLRPTGYTDYTPVKMEQVMLQGCAEILAI